MGRVLVIRHGQSEWNAAGRWQGWADIELSELGETQARHAAARLASLDLTFDRIVASDLRRAIRTAELLAEPLGLGPVHIEPELREFNVGDWSGLTRPEIEDRWPGQLEAWWRGALPQTPGGEPRQHFVDRVMDAVSHLASAESTVLAVAHGGVVGALQSATGVDGDRPRITNLSGRWFSMNGRAQLEPGELIYLLDPDESTAPSSR